MRIVFAKGLLNALISILGASLIIFIMSRLSGDPLSLLLPMDAPPSAVQAMRHELGLDRPMWDQYLIFEAVFARDYPVVQAGVLITSMLFVLSNFLVDLSYSIIDPRIRL